MVTVIIAVPSDTAVTVPCVETVATLSLSEDQVTFLLVALPGVIVTLNLRVPPITNVWSS